MSKYGQTDYSTYKNKAQSEINKVWKKRCINLDNISLLSSELDLHHPSPTNKK
jgi:hypothetical protein